MLRTTKGIAVATATLIALQGLIASGVCAMELTRIAEGSVEDMAEAIQIILAAVGVLVIGVLGTAIGGIRLIIKSLKDDKHPLFRLYADQLEKDTNLEKILRAILERQEQQGEDIKKHDSALESLIRDFMMKKAGKETGRPWEDT